MKLDLTMDEVTELRNKVVHLEEKNDSLNKDIDHLRSQLAI